MDSFTNVSQGNLLWFIIIAVIILVAGVAFWLIRRKSIEAIQLTQHNAIMSSLLDVEESAVLVSKKGIVDYINPSAEQLLKYKLRSARGKKHSDLLTLIDPLKRVSLNWLHERFHLNQVDYESCLLNCAGIQDLETSYLVRPFAFDGENATHYLLLLRDQAEVRALQLRLNYLEMHDERTGLLNRKSFELHLKIALDEARRHGIKHSFCHIALDQFKLVNDTMGHSAGDAFIERISSLLKDCIDRKLDILARIGGDEFGILFREMEPAVALKKAEQLRVKLERYDFVWNTQQHKITASIGFVPIYKKSGTPNRVLSVADAACRVAKEKGGNRLHLYRPDDEDVKRHRGQMAWIGKLRKAFEGGEFRLYAQPIQPLDPREFVKPFHHYEVLIRLFDESGNQISPDEFIPAAEYYSMMPTLDRWVVKELLKQLNQVNQRVPSPVFAVNLHGQTLDDPNFLPFVLDEIRSTGIKPSMLCFEITERMAISNLELAKKFITTLKELGCSFSLDDFGTGVSSFGYLKELPVDYLKIDGSFIKDILTDEVGRAMVQSVSQIGQLMDVQVIAEYVENNEIIRMLRGFGVDFGQGYGISKPRPIEEFVETHILK